ncbi:chemotaxis protein CheB [Pollutibacter soli]|uniref:chemotaxis protein CheB n=1 Tax=Pollutibacter soli TaxID=3034157 RepID=UPI003013BC5D
MRKAIRKYDNDSLDTETVTSTESIPVIIGISLKPGDEILMADFLEHLYAWQKHAAVILAGAGFESVLLSFGGWQITEAFDREPLLPGKIYTAPEQHFISVNEGMIRVMNVKKSNGLHGPVDTLFNAIAEQQSAGRVALILSSADHDGSNGFGKLYDNGGVTLAHTRIQNHEMKEQAHITGSVAALAEYLDSVLTKKVPFYANVVHDQPWLRLFSTTLAQAGESIMITDALNDEQIIYINDQFTHLTGYMKHEVMGRSPNDFLFDQVENEDSSPQQVHARDRNDGMQKQMLTRAKTIRWISQKIIPSFDLADNLTHFIYLITDITESRKRDEAMLMTVYAEKEKLRQEISAELHDNVNQILVTAQVTLGMAKNATMEEGREWIQRSNEYINMAVEEIRRLSHDIAPQVFDTDTFCLAVRDLVNGVNADKRFQLRFHFDPQLSSVKPDNELLLNLYRIIQEQLKNIVSYSEASKVSLSLNVSHGARLRLKISDNGLGFDMSSVRSGMGMMNMRRRTEFFDGKFELVAAPGKGCTIVAELPL